MQGQIHTRMYARSDVHTHTHICTHVAMLNIHICMHIAMLNSHICTQIAMLNTHICTYIAMLNTHICIHQLSNLTLSGCMASTMASALMWAGRGSCDGKRPHV